MNKNRKYTEPLSTLWRRHPQGSKTELVPIVRWITTVSLFIFLILTIVYLITGYLINALISAIGFIPLLFAFRLAKNESVTVSSAILAVTAIVLITTQATFGQGLYDIGVLGLPVTLIVMGLILRGRAIIYITFFAILCLGWLALSIQLGLASPASGALGNTQDFIIGGVIMLVAGNAVHRLSKNVYDTLEKAQQEIETRKQIETQRETLIHQLKSKNQELDRFAIRVSHDLKSPLITLAGFLGLLEKDIKEGKPERIDKDLTQINQAAKTMGKFVDELLDLSRIGRIINPPKDVAFETIVQDALKAIDGILKQKQAQVELDAIFPFVHVDRPRIVQVLQNLIVNAVKFMGDQQHPIIKIGFEEINGEHVFFVSDNGIGIASEHHEHIFELFNKLHPEIEGTGIGLGVVKKIIEVHNGRIWVESELGKGSTFKFTLGRPPQING